MSLELLKPEIIQGLEAFAIAIPFLTLAFSEKQRRWFLEVYNNKCQGSAIGMKHKCGGDLQIHHIMPQMWGYMHGMTEEQIDVANNGIPLCADAHIGSRGTKDCMHPDQAAAVTDYRYNHNEYAFGQLQERRQMMAQAGISYWNTKWDNNLRNVVRNTLTKLNGSKPFPSKNHRR